MNIKNFADEITIEKDENDRIIVDMTILDDSSFISPFCNKHPVISSDAADYLDSQLKKIPPKEEIAIRIEVPRNELRQTSYYEDAIKNYYMNESIQLGRDSFFCILSSGLLLLIGVILFSIMIFMQYKGIGEVWCSVMEIVSWVFIWESVDKIIFQRREINKNIKKNYKILTSAVTIISFDKEKELTENGK